MSRSSFKGPYIAPSIFKKIKKFKNLPNKPIIKTWSRNSTILPIMVGYTFSVYNGMKHIPLYVSPLLIGYKLGEFIPTRKGAQHKILALKLKRKVTQKSNK